ncbi:MAG: hypothetical protein ACOYB1_18705 [Limnohabitans sp.]
MFSIVEQADAILARLATIAGVNQIDIAEFIDNLENRPRTLPAVSLLPPAGKPKKQQNVIIEADNSWMVVIIAKSIIGPIGHLALMDSVLDALSGFQHISGIKPLVPVEWGLMNERIGEMSFASFVTFSTSQVASITWDVKK